MRTKFGGRQVYTVLLAASMTFMGSAAVAETKDRGAAQECKYTGYFAHGNPASLYGVNTDSGVSELIGATGKRYNAMGYNPLDGKIYAMGGGAAVYIIDPATGKITEEKTVADGEAGKFARVHYFRGDITPDGKKWYVIGFGKPQIINVDPASPNYLTHEGTFPGAIPGHDFAFHPSDGNIYTAVGKAIYRVDGETGERTTVGKSPRNDIWGGQWFDHAGNLYISGNGSGNVYKVDLTKVEDGMATLGESTKVGDSNKRTNHNDGASACIQTPDAPTTPPGSTLPPCYTESTNPDCPEQPTSPEGPGTCAADDLAVKFRESDYLKSSPASKEGGLKSINANTPTTVTFTNRLKTGVTVYWLNYQGKRVKYRHLRPCEGYIQQTYVTHPWVIQPDEGPVWGIFLPRARPGIADIK